MPSLRSSALPTVLCAAAVLAADTTRPQPEAPAPATRFVEVRGTAEQEVVPDRIVLRTKVSVREDAASEAVAAFRNQRTRVDSAFSDLGLGEVAIASEGLSLRYEPGTGDQMGGAVFIGGMDMSEPDPGVVCEETLRVSVVGADQLDDAGRANAVAVLIDTALDVGLQLGETRNPYVFYGADQQDELDLLHFETSREEELGAALTAAAFEDARARAAALADLAGATLGDVLEIEDRGATFDLSSSAAASTGRSTVRVKFELK